MAKTHISNKACGVSTLQAVKMIFVACQAHSINQYRNIRTKIMKCCANIYFNQQCLIRL